MWALNLKNQSTVRVRVFKCVAALPSSNGEIEDARGPCVPAFSSESKLLVTSPLQGKPCALSARTSFAQRKASVVSVLPGHVRRPAQTCLQHGIFGVRIGKS